MVKMMQEKIKTDMVLAAKKKEQKEYKDKMHADMEKIRGVSLERIQFYMKFDFGSATLNSRCTLLPLQELFYNPTMSFDDTLEEIRKREKDPATEIKWPAWWNDTFKEFYKSDKEFFGQTLE